MDLNIAIGALDNKRLTTVAVTQGAAGTFEVAPATTGQIHKLVSFVLALDADGTITLKSGTTALSGAIPVLAKVPFGLRQSVDEPIAHTAAGEALNITSATGKVFGIATYYTEGS